MGKKMSAIQKRGAKKALLMATLKLFHALFTLASFAFVWIFFHGAYLDRFDSNANFVICLVYTVVLILLFRTYNVYDVGYARTTDNVIGQIFSDFISLGIVYVIGSILSGGLMNPLYLLGLGVVQCLWDMMWSKTAKSVYHRIYKQRKTVVVYRNEDDLKRVAEIRYLEHKFKIEKYLENPEDDFKTLERELDGYQAVIVAGVNASLRNGIAKYCIEKGVVGYFAPHVGDVIMQGAQHLSSFSVPIMRVRRASKSPYYLFAKRVCDIAVSFLAIVLLSPVYLLTALAVKLYDRGPVFYKQVRLTKDGREFKILKFRSMRTDAEKDGVARLASENDDRITPVGKFIRACRLDELPQFFNIFIGDMSIVGPRPERPEIAVQYEEQMPAFSLRLQVKAGLTGFAQVYGKYNTSPYDKLQMDLMYINKMSVSEDIRLMFATLRILFMPDSTEGIDEGSTTALKEKVTEGAAVNK